MAVLSLSTNRCRACNAEKPIGEFYVVKGRGGAKYADNKCKACRSKHNHENVKRLRLTEAGRRKIRQHKTNARRNNGALPRAEWINAKRAAKVIRVNYGHEARKAWRHWIKDCAPSEWLDAYYARAPWLDHRLSDAEQFRLQYRNDPEFNLKQRLRAAMKRKRQGIRLGELLRWAVERNGSSPRAEQFVGYTAKELRQHIERQFTKGMNWSRFCAGEIHIDHIVPLTAYDISNPNELRAAWALTNLRPLWAKENIAKSANRLHLL